MDTVRKHDFVDLPSEVRLTIYKHFFSGQPRMITDPGTRPFPLIDDRHWNLLLVSKAIYREALPEYYRSCIFGLTALNLSQMQRLLKDKAKSDFGQYVSRLMVWRIPEPCIFDQLPHIRWVSLIGITCGVEPVNGRIYTYNTLMTALRTARVPGFSWSRCHDLFKQYHNIEFMLNFRCDYPETKFNLDGHPSRRWVKTNFVYYFRTDTFEEETRGTNKQDRLILKGPDPS